jgi:hypothetical protein
MREMNARRVMTFGAVDPTEPDELMTISIGYPCPERQLLDPSGATGV